MRDKRPNRIAFFWLAALLICFSGQPAGHRRVTPKTHTFDVGTEPIASVWSGTNLFVANLGDDTISILDGQGTLTGTIQTYSAPVALAWDGTRLWVANLGTDQKPGNSVALYDETGQKLKMYKIGDQPNAMSYDADDSLMWIALSGDKVIAVDAKGKITKTVNVISKGHNLTAILWANGQLWAALSGTDAKPGNTVIAVDNTGTISGAFTVGQAPAALAWNDANPLLYTVNYRDGSITALGAGGAIVGTYSVGRGPSGLAWDGTRLWVTLYGENVVVALDSSGKLLFKIPTDVAPGGLTFDGQSSVWVALTGTTDKPGSQVMQIDLSSITIN